MILLGTLDDGIRAATCSREGQGNIATIEQLALWRPRETHFVVVLATGELARGDDFDGTSLSSCA